MKAVFFFTAEYWILTSLMLCPIILLGDTFAPAFVMSARETYRVVHLTVLGWISPGYQECILAAEQNAEDLNSLKEVLKGAHEHARLLEESKEEMKTA